MTKKEEMSSQNTSSKIERTDFKTKKSHYLSHRSQTQTVIRKIPKPEDLERRQNFLRWTKWGLPATALVLLGSIAVWPEIDRALNSNKEVLKELSKVKVESGTMMGATFHGLDTHNRPYTVTSERVNQNTSTSDVVKLTSPKADILLQNGDWLMVSADKGTFLQHTQNLDLKQNVVLYRNDGLFMYSPIADIALKSSVVTANKWIHAEGPFGVLDAQAYFLDLHAGIAQFAGPGRLVLNDDQHASSPVKHASNSAHSHPSSPPNSPATSSESPL